MTTMASSKTKIKLTEEAARAIKLKGPSDNQLRKILLSNANKDMPDSRTCRWLAAQVLGQYGYTFEV